MLNIACNDQHRHDKLLRQDPHILSPHRESMAFQGRLHRRPAALAAERKRSVKHSSWVRASASAKRFFAQIWQNCKLALTLISGSSTPRSTSTPSPSRSRGEARDGVTTTATFGIADYGSSSTSTTSARGLPWRHHHQPRPLGLQTVGTAGS